MAIRTAATLAKGPAGLPEQEYGSTRRARWYGVLAYLAQTLNGLMNDADENVAKKQLADLRRMVEELRDGETQFQA